MPELIAGFDAGQTHTRCRLALLEAPGRWRVVAQGEGPGVSHLDAPGGEPRFSAALQQSLAAAVAQLEHSGGREDPALAAAAIGASGIEAGSSVQPRGQQLAAQALQLPPSRIVVTGDERTALEGARGEHTDGILLISGTGCIALGCNAAGQLHRCGGWGWLLDGAGSAMDIGRDGLALSLQMADGRQPDTALRPALWQALGLASDAADAPQAIKGLVVQFAFGAAGFARLAPVVHAQAAAGDAQALAIVQRSADALAAMASAIAQRLQLQRPPVWTSGGAIDHLKLLRQGLETALSLTCPGARLAEADGDGCDGALRLASRLLLP
ncbi:MAG: N-acetylglucosamine kinase [Cyanobacteria bacterium M_surface_9_m1_291]|nr:N-acetylglucosamine kinase [Cyanobacteria bacterium M_surface_9_m1_291]